MYFWQICNFRVISTKTNLSEKIVEQINAFAHKTLEKTRPPKVNKAMHICYFNMIKNEQIIINFDGEGGNKKVLKELLNGFIFLDEEDLMEI